MRSVITGIFALMVFLCITAGSGSYVLANDLEPDRQREELAQDIEHLRGVAKDAQVGVLGTRVVENRESQATGPGSTVLGDNQGRYDRDEEASQHLVRFRFSAGAEQLDTLEAAATEYQEKWFAKDARLYGSIALEICGVFTSFPLADDRQYELARQHATLALDRLEGLSEEQKMPLELQLKLVTGYLQSMFRFKEEAAKEDWLERRGVLTKYYFDAWTRLEKAIDPNFDPNDPLPPAPIPAGYTGIWLSGMSPTAIEDDAVRARYENTLQDYWEGQERYSSQRRFRRLKERFVPKLQQQLLRLYSGPLFESTEFEGEFFLADLERCVSDAGIRQGIRDSLEHAAAAVEGGRPEGGSSTGNN